MARCRWRLESPSACVPVVVHEVEVESVLQQKRIKSALPGNEAGSVQSFGSTDTEQSDTMRVVFDCAILLTELFRNGAESQAWEIIKIFQYDNFHIEKIRNKFKRVTSCRKLVQKTLFKYLKKKNF